MEDLKREFLQAIENDLDLLKFKWAELEKRFGIPSTGRPGDRARKWVRTWQKNNETGQTFVSETTSYDTEVPAGLRVKSVWQVLGKGGETKTLRSYAADSTSVEEFRTLLLEDMQKYSPEVPDFAYSDFTDENLLEIAIPDFHIGRESLQASGEVFMKALSEIVTEASKGAAISKILFPIGNDWLNTDNLDYRTTKGTQQFDVAPWYETFRYGWQILVKAIEFASQFAPVDVIIVPGNHDKSKMFYIGDVVASYFRNNKNITVDNSGGNFKFYRFGQSLIMYEHGELKPADYPLILADERKQDWAETKYREVHVGHFHKEMVLDEYRGVKIRFLPSLSNESDWEKERGYNHLKQAQGLVFNKERGLRNTYYYHE